MKKQILPLAIFVAAGIVASGQQMIYDHSFDPDMTITCSPDNATKANLFDRKESTLFTTSGAGTQTLMFTAPRAFVLTGVSVLNAGNSANDPKAFRMYGSNNGETWTQLKRGESITFSGRYTPVSVLATVTTPYTQFKIEIDGQTDGLRIAEMQLLGYYAESEHNMLTPETGTLKVSSGQGGDNIANDNVRESYKAGSRQATIEFTLNAPAMIDSYALTASNTPNATPAAWELYGSNDGENWEIIDMRSNRSASKANFDHQVYRINDKSYYPDWGACADLALESLERMFWRQYGQGYYLINTYHPNQANERTSYNYWWMAHAIDVMIDAYNRTHNEKYHDMANRLRLAQYQYGMWIYNRNDLWNSFFDDMEWMALACIRAYLAFGEDQWLDEAKQLWTWIRNGWNDNLGGGIMWNDGTPYGKNSCSNAPAIIIAGKMQRLLGGRVHQAFGQRIWDWMSQNSLFDNGMVKDAPDNDNFGWTFSYNQGTWAGGSLQLYDLTKDQKYYDAAVTTLDYVVDNRDYSPAGILCHGEDGGGDGGLFKGIFIRNLADWVLSGYLDSERQYKYTHFLLECGRSQWNSATAIDEARFHGYWLTKPRVLDPNNSNQEGYDASTHLSGLMLLEACDLIERSGVVEATNREPKEYSRYRLVVTATNGSDLVLSRWQLLNSNYTGVSEVIAESDIDILPVGSAVRIVSNAPANYTVVTPDGRTVANGNITETTDLPVAPGIYIVRATTPSATITRTLSVK